ncbi:hypothetical protein ACQ4PT_058959 [Festuca glaucescens]
MWYPGGVLLAFLIGIFVSAAKLFSVGRDGISELRKCIWFDDPSRLLHCLRIPVRPFKAVKCTGILQCNMGCFKLVLLILILAPTTAYCTECPSSIYDHAVNSEGALQFPVFHREHACAQESLGHLRPTDDMKLDINVTREPSLNTFAYLMPIKIGTPPIWNLVTFDSGSTLSFVQCEPCTVSCHEQKPGAGQIFDPTKSTTLGRVGCSTEVPFSPKEPGRSTYSVGKLVTDTLTLGPNDVSVLSGFIFGCSLDTEYHKFDAGIMGFGAMWFSFFMQVSRLVGYKAFSYCFPSDTNKPGYLSIGNYSSVSSSYSTPLSVAVGPPVYSLKLDGVSVNGTKVMETSSEIIVDTGTENSYLLSDTFDMLDAAVTPAVESLGYKRDRVTTRADTAICFDDKWHTTFKDWPALPVVELLFASGAKLRLPPQNVFYNDGDFGLCMYFRRDEAGVKGKQILGSSITKSIGLTFDIEGSQFVFQDGDC